MVLRGGSQAGGWSMEGSKDVLWVVWMEDDAKVVGWWLVSDEAREVSLSPWLQKHWRACQVVG